MDGKVRSNPDEITSAFEEYYINLLGTTHQTSSKVNAEIINYGQILNEQQQNFLTQDFTDEDIKQAIFSIPGSKAPGPDGYNSTFFKASWSIIGGDVCKAVRDFFNTGQLLKELNCTKLTLIPKVTHPQHVIEFRPIACCNTLYKCITKLICSRLKQPAIIAPNQSGFIQGRQIVIMLALFKIWLACIIGNLPLLVAC